MLSSRLTSDPLCILGDCPLALSSTVRCKLPHHTRPPWDHQPRGHSLAPCHHPSINCLMTGLRGEGQQIHVHGGDRDFVFEPAICLLSPPLSKASMLPHSPCRPGLPSAQVDQEYRNLDFPEKINDKVCLSVMFGELFLSAPLCMTETARTKSCAGNLLSSCPYGLHTVPLPS